MHIENYKEGGGENVTDWSQTYRFFLDAFPKMGEGTKKKKAKYQFNKALSHQITCRFFWFFFNFLLNLVARIREELIMVQNNRAHIYMKKILKQKQKRCYSS